MDLTDGGAGGEEGNEDDFFMFDENKLHREAHAAEVDAEATASQVVVQADDISSAGKKLQTAIVKDQLHRETEVCACIYTHATLLTEQSVVKLDESAQLESETDWINIVRHCY